ncbi:MAG TPA: methyltransferase domain-containing protein [Tepidisphaeraceae bacterium]|nr:methyltransferase domain-containing protein [Tepidisphaeraceae bacterium]
MEESQVKQQVYFDRIADEFDQHYATQKPLTEKIIDRIFRQGMVQRWEYLTQKMDWTGQTVLDVGCGPGRYMAAFIAKGAAKVTGLDFAAAMIGVAQNNLQKVGAMDRCELIVGDFLTAKMDRTFDTIVAMGYFDYILGQAALDEHFGRMWKMANKRVVASFPYRWSFKTFPRWVWLSMRNCPVQFFTPGEVKAMMQRLGIGKYELIRMSGTILAIAHKA